MARAISPERFHDEPGREAVRHAGFDDVVRLEMPHETPDGSHQSGVAVIVAVEAFRADVDSLFADGSHRYGPCVAKFGGRGAWKGCGQRRMNLPLPVGGCVMDARTAAVFAFLHDPVLKRLQETQWIGLERGNCPLRIAAGVMQN